MYDSRQNINLHVSVDCVLIGFDGMSFRVLLVKQLGKNMETELNDMKLPGSLIYDDEDLDEAARRVLNELTGLKNVKMLFMIIRRLRLSIIMLLTIFRLKGLKKH